MNLSNVTKRYVGKPYRLGGLDVSKGCDCFSMIIDYLREYGIKIPARYRGYNVFEYAKLFKQNPGIMDTAISFIQGLTQEIPGHKCMAGDIIVATIKDKDNPIPSFGIDAGNGNMLIVSDQKVGLIHKKYYTINKVFRCHKQSRQ